MINIVPAKEQITFYGSVTDISVEKTVMSNGNIEEKIVRSYTRITDSFDHHIVMAYTFDKDSLDQSFLREYTVTFFAPISEETAKELAPKYWESGMTRVVTTVQDDMDMPCEPADAEDHFEEYLKEIGA